MRIKKKSRSKSQTADILGAPYATSCFIEICFHFHNKIKWALYSHNSLSVSSSWMAFIHTDSQKCRILPFYIFLISPGAAEFSVNREERASSFWYRRTITYTQEPENESDILLREGSPQKTKLGPMDHMCQCLDLKTYVVHLACG